MALETTDTNLNNVTQKFYDTFTNEILNGQIPNWQNVSSTFSGTPDGGASIGANSIIMPVTPPQNGAGAVIRRRFKLNTLLDAKKFLSGDTIEIRAVIVESPAGSLDTSNFGLSLKVNGTTTPTGIVEVARLGTSLVQYKFDYVVQATNDELEVSFTVASGFATSSSARTYTWNAVDIYYELAALDQSIDRLTDYANDVVVAKAYVDSSPVISKCVANDVTDDTVALQAEINNAIAGSGTLILKEGIYRITSTLAINGFIRIIGKSPDKTRINAFLSTNLFEINTNQPFSFEDFRIFRSSGNSLIQTAIKFSNNLVINDLTNKGSMIRRLKIDTVTGIEVDQCENMRIINSEFTSINQIKIGMLSNNVNDLEIVGNTFLNAFGGSVINSKVCRNFRIINNRVSYTGAFYCDYFIKITLSNIAHTGLLVSGNTVEQARVYAVSIQQGEAGATISNVTICDNNFLDASTSTTSGGIQITNTNLNTRISGNFISNKLIALYISESQRVLFTGNIINGLGPSSTSKAFRLTNCTYMRVANIETGQSTLPGYENSAIGCTLLTEQPIP